VAPPPRPSGEWWYLGGIAYAGSVGPAPALGDSPARQRPQGVGHQPVVRFDECVLSV